MARRVFQAPEGNMTSVWNFSSKAFYISTKNKYFCNYQTIVLWIHLFINCRNFKLNENWNRSWKLNWNYLENQSMCSTWYELIDACDSTANKIIATTDCAKFIILIKLATCVLRCVDTDLQLINDNSHSSRFQTCDISLTQFTCSIQMNYGARMLIIYSTA